MALRSIGSSLVGKAAPGSPLRETTEQGIQTPAIPGKGEPGSLERQFVEEPFQRVVPPGSQKVVSVTPGADVTAVSSPGEAPAPTPEEQALLAGAVGNANQPTPGAPGANGQPLFQGGITSPGGNAPAPTPPVPGQPPVSNAPAPRPTAAPAAPRGRTPTFASRPGVPQAIPEGNFGPTPQNEGAQSNTQAPANISREGFLPTLFSILSGRSVAAPGPGENKPTVESRGIGATGVERQGNKVSFTPTAGQLAAGKIGKVISNVGTALHAPQLAPGGIGAQLQRFGGAVQPAIAGVGSISSGLRSLANTGQNVLRSVSQAASPVINNLRSGAQNVANRISSFFRRR